MGIYQRIERLILMMESICLGIANVLLSNQFHTFMYGVGLFANNPILYSAVVGFIYGYVIFTCSEYDYANQFDFKKISSHLVVMHTLCFLSLNVINLWSLFFFYPTALVGLGLLGSVFIVYNQSSAVSNPNKITYFGLTCMLGFVFALAFGYGWLCTAGLGIVIGFDLTSLSFAVACTVTWLGLNFLGFSELSFYDQCRISCVVFTSAIATLFIFQCHIPVLLYLVPAIHYYVCSSLLSPNHELPNNDLKSHFGSSVSETSSTFSLDSQQSNLEKKSGNSVVTCESLKNKGINNA